jgi:serine/threonine protein kinase
MGSACGKNKVSKGLNLPAKDFEQFTSAVPVSATAKTVCQDSELKFQDVYDICNLLGTGSFGGVHRAIRKTRFLGLRTNGRFVPKEVAVKVVCQTDKSYAEAKRQLEGEFSILSGADHPHIIHAYGLFAKETTGDLFLINDFCKGGDIIDMLALQQPAFPEKDCATICRHIISALEYLHRKNIVHRYLKLGNLLLKRKNDLNSIVIADFGMACFSDTVASSQRVCGTDGPYLAPEVKNAFEADACGIVSESGSISFPVDIWCLGVISHIFLCGCEPAFRKNTTDTADEIWGFSVSDDDFSEKEDGCISNSDYGMSEIENQHHERGLSDEARDFVTCMLRLSSRDRPSATELMDHPFLKQ